MRKTLMSALMGATMLVGLAACGTSSGNTDTFNVHVTGTKSDVGDFSARKGDTIKLTFTADKDEEIHLHGYDIHFDCKAGVPLEKTFTADKTGQFEYELEKTAEHLGNLTVNP